MVSGAQQMCIRTGTSGVCRSSGFAAHPNLLLAWPHCSACRQQRKSLGRSVDAVGNHVMMNGTAEEKREAHVAAKDHGNPARRAVPGAPAGTATSRRSSERHCRHMSARPRQCDVAAQIRDYCTREWSPTGRCARNWTGGSTMEPLARVTSGWSTSTRRAGRRSRRSALQS